jgi:hypothetical protein
MFAIPSLPYIAASINAVCPFLFCLFTLAPFSTNISTHSDLPLFAASIKGVLPSVFTAFISAPNFINFFKANPCPFLLAIWMALY